MRVLRCACDRCGKELKDWEVEKVSVTFMNKRHLAELCEPCKEIVENLIEEAITLYKREHEEATKEILPKFVKGSLTAEQKDVVTILQKEGKSINDISMILNKHPDTIRTWLTTWERYNPAEARKAGGSVAKDVTIPEKLRAKHADVTIVSPDVAIVNGEQINLAKLRFRRKQGWADNIIAMEMNINKDFIKDIIIAYNRYVEAKKGEQIYR